MNVLQKLNEFYLDFSGIKGSIGKSVLGKDIYYFKVSHTDYPVLIVQYAIHAREYITTYLALKQITDFLSSNIGTVYFIPATNPDGIEISLNVDPLYKANARGVDLNVNFDARWGTGQDNVRVAGSANYIGKTPFSEPETVCLRNFTYDIMPNMTISYHSKGEEIYYQFHQDSKSETRYKKIAEKLSGVTGYPVRLTPNSAGGYKDWCIEKLNIPAMTIEVGKDSLSHPILENSLDEIYKKNKKVIDTAILEIYEGKVYERGD